MSKRVETTIREQERHWRVVAKRFKGRHQRWMVAGVRASFPPMGASPTPSEWASYMNREMVMFEAEGWIAPNVAVSEHVAAVVAVKPVSVVEVKA